MMDPVVETKNGKLRGVVKKDFDDHDYYAFKGIPYAKPPINDLRFKDPEPMDNWSGIRQATEFGNECLQYYSMARRFIGSEDCLYLNVYTKSIKSLNKLSPVMVWIHGGAFVFGSADDTQFGPEYLMRKDIVLVTLNYRLGIFGFFNLEDEICPGNQGLKDQLMALRWVQDNIKNFGGDPNNVTLFGESSGAACSHILAVSPLSKGLFHRLICQSGTAANVWTRVRDPEKPIYRLCTSLGKYTRNPIQIYKFIKNYDGEKLIRVAENIRRQIAESTKHQNCDTLFGPSVDNFSPNPVMPIPAEEAALEGVKVPFLLGYNSFEGSSLLLDQLCFAPIKDSDYQAINLNFHSCLHPEVKNILSEYDMTIDDLKRMYFGDKKITHEQWKSLATLLGDFYFNISICNVLENQVKQKCRQTYFYKFSYDQSMTITKLFHTRKFKGANHFDEVSYLFYSHLGKKLGFPSLKIDPKGHQIMEMMTEMWTNFATYGNPTPETTDLLPVKWEPVGDAAKFRALNIDEELSMEFIPHTIEKYKNYKTSIN